ncbi:hypothetical protein D3C80_1994300 [compost metagenome]
MVFDLLSGDVIKRILRQRAVVDHIQRITGTALQHDFFAGKGPGFAVLQTADRLKLGRRKAAGR